MELIFEKPDWLKLAASNIVEIATPTDDVDYSIIESNTKSKNVCWYVIESYEESRTKLGPFDSITESKRAAQQCYKTKLLMI